MNTRFPLRIRARLPALVALLLAQPTAGGAQEPEPLASQRTRGELLAVYGEPRVPCVAIRPGLELCEWSLGNREPAWRPLARSIGTDARVAILCELPTDGGARAPGSCTLYPRESDHAPWALPNVAPSRRGSGSVAERRAKREEISKRARATLAEAGTLLEISRLVGAAPDECVALQPGLRSCLWRATSRTRGHGLLAATIEAPRRKKVRLVCRLPADDAPRAPDSCEVEIGS